MAFKLTDYEAYDFANRRHIGPSPQEMKEMLEVTDGNLASHVAALERSKYIEVRKQFIGRRPNTSYKATPEGRKAFTEHLNALEKLIKGT